MNHFKGVVVIVLITVMVSIICDGKNSNQTSVAKEIDCTSSHKSWEISLEDFEKYCMPSFCDCYDQGDSVNCAKWEKDFFDGLAMMWYQQNVDNAVNPCRILIKTDTTTEFLEVRRDWTGFESNIKGVGDNRDGNLKFWMVSNKPIKVKLNTKALFTFRFRVKEYMDSYDYYPSSYRITNPRPVNNDRVVLFDTRIIGPFGGIGGLDNGWFQFNKYLSLMKKEDTNAFVEPILLTNAFLLRQNPRIKSISISMKFHMCLGRKINPQTKRTHWTGEGCVPKIYFKQYRRYESEPGQPLPNWEYNENYEVLCECEFTSLGTNAPDDPPDMKLDPDFNNKLANEPIADKVYHFIYDASKATNLTTIIAIVLVVICLIFIVLTIGSVVYFKVLAKN